MSAAKEKQITVLEALNQALHDAFADDPKTSNEPKLEAIQMAWYEEYKDARE